MNTIVLSSNTAWYLYNFRGGLIQALLARGERLVILAPPDKYSVRLTAWGCEVVDFPMDNKGANPVRDAALFLAYYRLYRRLQPAAVLHYTVKPVIYGGLAARLLRIPCISTITGLGTAFIRESWLTRVVESLYRVSQRKVYRVFFQNQEDRALFLRRRLAPEYATAVLPGSGVDLSWYAVTAMPCNNETVFLLIARMVKDKGICEYVEAARQVKSRYPRARFQLLGFLEVENRTAISGKELKSWVSEGVVEYLGEMPDVRPAIAAADCVVLPSYREGMPRTLLEAAAMGRPIITTEVAGCRDVVEDGVNGYLCRARDVGDLTDKMLRFLVASAEARSEMGRRGRSKVERDFDERIVIRHYLQTLDSLARRRLEPDGL